MRRWRLFFLVLVVLALLGGVALAGFKIYLGTDLAALRAATHLARIYGGAVEIDRLDVGMEKTALFGVRFFQTGDLPGDEPWLSIKEAHTDLSLMDVALDQTLVSRVSLVQPVATLRFNREGELVTRVPKSRAEAVPWPTVDIHEGVLHLQQEGHPEMVVTGLEATLQLRNEGLFMEGTVTDPFWGDWQANGNLDLEKLKGQLHLRNDGCRVFQEKLQKVAFVPPSVWEEVRLDGETPVDFTFSYDLAANKFRYILETRPVHTRVFVSCIDLQVEEASGQVRVDNGVVYLNEVHGQSADGEISTKAELKCRQEPKEMHFAVEVKHLDLRKLPPSWHLPRQISGRLDGNADLQVIVRNHKTRTFGQGEGVVKETRFSGFPIKNIPILLQADGDHLQFKPLQTVQKP